MIGDKGLARILAAAVCTPQNDSASLLCRPGNASAAGNQRVTSWQVYPGTLGTNGAVARIAGHRLDTVEGGAPVLDFLGACWS